MGTICLPGGLLGTGVSHGPEQGAGGWQGEGPRAPQKEETGTAADVGPSLRLEHPSRLALLAVAGQTFWRRIRTTGRYAKRGPPRVLVLSLVSSLPRPTGVGGGPDPAQCTVWPHPISV